MSKPNPCGNHRPYRSKAEAAAMASWHLTCWKCRAGRVMNVWQCERGEWHIGHRDPDQQRAVAR